MATTDDPDDERFEVSASSESAAESREFEGANVCRVAALSTMLGNQREAVQELEPELAQLGFSDRLRSGEWDWGDVSLVDAFGALRQDDTPREARRIRNWETLAEAGRPEHAVGFLVAVLGSRLERESAAAAAAIWRAQRPFDRPEFWRGPRGWHLWERLVFDVFEPGWPEEGWWGFPWSPSGLFELPDPDDVDTLEWDPERWTTIYERATSRTGDPYGNAFLVRMLAGWRLARGLRSPDPVTRSLSLAAFPPEPVDGANELSPVAPRSTPPGALVASTMIHGTWGWKGDWWRPQAGNFHEFILRNHRPNLYSRGAKFSWSGAYRESHRKLAATDFCEWAYDVAPHGLQSVFAHSYGGEVAARAAIAGARIAELVLLSVPGTAPVEAAADVPGIRVVDIRLPFDPVLALARTRQRIRSRPNVAEVLLTRWSYDHGASHREDVWQDEDVARRGAI